MLQRVKEVQESDLRMDGALARNIQRVLAVTQADIDAAAAQGKAWVVKPVVKVSDPLDNMRGGTQLVIKQNSILPGQNVMRVMYVGGTAVVVGPDVPPLSLPDATANDLLSLTAFGGTKFANVPAGYTELEYVTFDGTQVVDTGQNISLDDEIQIKFKGTATGFLLGADTANPRVTFYVSPGGNQRWGTGVFSQSGVPALNTLYTLIQNKYGFTLNGTLYQFTESTDFTTTNTLTIGNCNGNTSTAKFSGNVYYAKFYKNGVLKVNLIPCKNSSDVVGFFDTVSQTFIQPTTGTLVAGDAVTTIVPTPDVPSGILCNNGVLDFRDTELPLGYRRLKDVIFDGETYYVTDVFLTGADTTSFVINAAESGRNALGCYTGNSAGNNISFYIATGNSGNYVRYKDGLYRPVIATAKLNTDLTLSIGPTGTTGFDTDATWAELEFTCPNELYIGWLANATSPRFIGSFKGNITVSNRATLVPCERVSDGAIGYYNINDGVFFENQGTGTPTTSGYDYTHCAILGNGPIETIATKDSNSSVVSTATTEILLSVDTYTDQQEVIGGSVARKCGAVILDSSLEWTYDGTYGRVNATIPNLWGSTVARTVPGFCTHFEWLSHQESISSITPGQCYSASAGRIFLHISQTSADAFSAWLDAQKNAGTPVIIVFPLENATTNSVAGQPMQTAAGNNTVEITQAGMDGLEVEAEYLKED